MSSNINPKKLLENYKDYCSNVNKNRIHIVYFKVLLKHNKKESDSDIIEISSDDYEKVLDIIQTYDFYKFFENNLIIVENYNIEFLVNPKGEYFIKLELLFPELGSLLEYKNSTCICTGCNEPILSYTDFLCNNHLNSDIIDNFDQINTYFYIRSKELEEIYNSYKKQTDINNYLIEKETQNDCGMFALNELRLNGVTCYLKLSKEIDDLIEIDLTSMINNLDCMIMNEHFCFDDNSIISDNMNEDIDEYIDEDLGDIIDNSFFQDGEDGEDEKKGDDIIDSNNIPEYQYSIENKEKEYGNGMESDCSGSGTDIDTDDTSDDDNDIEIGMKELDNILNNIKLMKKEYSTV